MNKLRIVTVQFDFEQSTDYARLLAVFEKSVRDKMPRAEFVCHRIPAPAHRPDTLHKAMTANTKKLHIWSKEMTAADCPVIFCDCDMLATGDLSEVFGWFEYQQSEGEIKKPFDVAFTERDAKYPLNAGAVYARPTDEARLFFTQWDAANLLLFNNRSLHRVWREKYAGMNQAALGYLLETQRVTAKVARIPCQIWNACDGDWSSFSSSTRLVHVKGKLRSAVLGNLAVSQMEPHLQPIAEIWRGYENGTI